MYPVSTRVLGTGISTPIIPDTFQNPFNIGVGVVATNATYSVQHCFDYSAVMSPTWNGTTATWFDNSGITATALATVNGNYAFPVAAIRLNVTGANATSVVTMMLIQAQEAP
jgi:hypothetical protein